MFALGFVGIVLTFALDNACDACEDVHNINDSIECVMLTCMIIASVLVYCGIYRLDVNPSPISFLDNLLLLICFPSFFLLTILNIISGFENKGLNSSVATNILIVSTYCIQASYLHLEIELLRPFCQ